MSEIYIISDTHFNHNNILTFKDKNDNLIRPMFETVEQMNQVMIDNWNRVVRPNDTVIHLGDVIFGQKQFYGRILGQLNGIKTLIMGNHDYEATSFIPYFSSIKSVITTGKHFKQQYIMSHYPVAESSLYNNQINIHGHIHQNKINDSRYINLCVEHTNYTPINIQQILDGTYNGSV